MIGDHFKTLLNLFAGLAIATGLAQVAPRIFYYAERTPDNAPEFLPWTSLLALAIGIAEVLAIFVQESYRNRPILVYLDFIGEILVFLLFATAHLLQWYLVILTIFCITLVCYRCLDPASKGGDPQWWRIVRTAIIGFGAGYWLWSNDYLAATNRVAVYVTLLVVTALVVLAYCPILKQVNTRFEREKASP
jgi:uncharacterized membrane protein HdeD (DUF308 family)